MLMPATCTVLLFAGDGKVGLLYLDQDAVDCLLVAWQLGFRQSCPLSAGIGVGTLSRGVTWFVHFGGYAFGLGFRSVISASMTYC